MRVGQLWRYPVKSMQGERLETARLDRLGIAGDRQWAVVDLTSGMTLTGRREPLLLWASAALQSDGDVQITLPDGTRPSSSTDASTRLSAWLGRAVQLRRAGGGSGTYEIAPDFEHEDFSVDALPWLHWDGPIDTFHDSTRTKVSIGSLDELRDWDPRRFRFNVIVSGGSVRPLEGKRVGIGSTELEVVKPIDRCVMTTRAQPGGVERDLGVLRTIIKDLGNELGVGALVDHEGQIGIGDELAVQG